MHTTDAGLFAYRFLADNTWHLCVYYLLTVRSYAGLGDPSPALFVLHALHMIGKPMPVDLVCPTHPRHLVIVIRCIRVVRVDSHVVRPCDGAIGFKKHSLNHKLRSFDDWLEELGEILVKEEVTRETYCAVDQRGTVGRNKVAIGVESEIRWKHRGFALDVRAAHFQIQKAVSVRARTGRAGSVFESKCLVSHGGRGQCRGGGVYFTVNQSEIMRQNQVEFWELTVLRFWSNRMVQ